VKLPIRTPWRGLFVLALLCAADGSASAKRRPRAAGKEGPAPSTETPPATSKPASKPAPKPAPQAPTSAPVDTVAASATVEPRRAAPWHLGMSVDLYQESSGLNGHQTLNVMESNESFDYSAGTLAARAWLWLPQTRSWRWGGGATWRGRYSATDDDGDAYVFGQLCEAYGHIDRGFPLPGRWRGAVAGRAGLAVLFPEGDFSDEISRLQEGGVSVWSGPRFGWLLGAAAGVRYPIGERVTFVGDLGVEAERIYLFATQDTTQSINVSKTWRNEITRVSVSLGVEVPL
jgi:hypothetical protein